METVFHIRNFTYNGFFGQRLKGAAPYTAKFVEWTCDPGVAKMTCSDGKTRLIPSFAVVEWEKLPPEPDYKKMKEEKKFLYFGAPSSSK